MLVEEKDTAGIDGVISDQAIDGKHDAKRTGRVSTTSKLFNKDKYGHVFRGGGAWRSLF